MAEEVVSNVATTRVSWTGSAVEGGAVDVIGRRGKVAEQAAANSARGIICWRSSFPAEGVVAADGGVGAGGVQWKAAGSCGDGSFGGLDRG